MPRFLRPLLTGIFFAALLAITGCDAVGLGGSETPVPVATPTFDAAQADAVAHAAMMSAQGMPGGNWVVYNTDYFLEDTVDGPQSKECEAADAEGDRLFGQFDSTIIGRAANTYAEASIADSEFSAPSFNAEVMVFSTVGAAQVAVDAEREGLTNKTMQACAVARMQERAGPDARVKFRQEPVAFYVAGVQSSGTSIVEATMPDGTPLKRVSHQYNWRLGNAVVGLTAWGTDFTRDMAIAAVNGTQKRLQLLAKGVALEPEPVSAHVAPKPETVPAADYVEAVCNATAALVADALSQSYSGDLSKMEPALAHQQVLEHYDSFTGAALRYLSRFADAGVPDVADGEAIAEGFLAVAGKQFDIYREARARAGLLPATTSDELMRGVVDIALDVAKGSIDLQKLILEVTRSYDTSALDGLFTEGSGCNGFGTVPGTNA